MAIKINELVELAHENAVNKGFWDEPRETGTLLMLIVSEVTEALNAYSCANFCEELADICIRIFDLFGGLELNLETVLSAVKNDYDYVLIDLKLQTDSFTSLEKSLSVVSVCFGDEYLSSFVVKELSYALEHDRKGNRGTFAQKVAKAFIYTLKWAAHKGYSIEEAVMEKMKLNKERPRLHGKKY